MGENETGAPAGRPLTRRGRETRQRIVAAAAERMFDNGVAETTLEDIRAAAGVSSSQVYHYFEDKQALVRAVIDYQTNAVLDAQGAHLDRLDSMAGLRAWRDLLVEHQRRLGCRGGCPIGALGAEVAETDAVARLAESGGCAAGKDGSARDSRPCTRAATSAPGTDPDDLALATLAALQGGLLLTQLQRDTRPLEVTLDAMLDRVQTLTAEQGIAAIWASIGPGRRRLFRSAETRSDGGGITQPLPPTLPPAASVCV